VLFCSFEVVTVEQHSCVGGSSDDAITIQKTAILIVEIEESFIDFAFCNFKKKFIIYG
jgi:hypothetical protein